MTPFVVHPYPRYHRRCFRQLSISLCSRPGCRHTRRASSDGVPTTYRLGSAILRIHCTKTSTRFVLSDVVLRQPRALMKVLALLVHYLVIGSFLPPFRE